MPIFQMFLQIHHCKKSIKIQETLKPGMTTQASFWAFLQYTISHKNGIKLLELYNEVSVYKRYKSG